MRPTRLLLFIITLFCCSLAGSVQSALRCDTIAGSDGNLRITFIGHASLMIEWNKMVIHVDPVDKASVYASLPKADIILITHEHGDHFELPTIALLKKPTTTIVGTAICSQQLKGITVIENGAALAISAIKIESVPAYNIIQKRPDGKPYHEKGTGNGYVLTLGNKRVYIAGDTENIPEMISLKNIDITFLPMNLPYTMTPQMVADAARMFMPQILYPYHYGKTDPKELVTLLKGTKIDIRIRDLQ